jgi:hypothetical protein
MLPDKHSRRIHTEIYESLVGLSPWNVLVDEEAVAQILDLVALQPSLEGFVNERLLKGLQSFPPDPKFFTDPEMSWDNPLIWVTITERHIRIRVKAEYRKNEHICWVVEVRAEG